MTRLELRASTSLASIFALRMLGLFLILPVFAVHARGLPGGDNATLVGLALGVYGLTQGLLQLPYGMLSDRVGRKPVIIAGLLLFAVGSFVAAIADSVTGVIVGRALQGAGAISAAVTAMISDATRDSQRTKAMAMVGGSIGLTFALSLVVSPLLYASIGMGGIFALTGVLALGATAVVGWIVPSSAAMRLARAAAQAGLPPEPMPARPTRLVDVVTDPDLLTLNLGIFVLHAVQIAMFVVVPTLLVEQAGLPLSRHWTIYLPVVLCSFAVMMPPLGWAERHGRLRTVFLAAIGLIALVQFGFALQPTGLIPLAGLLLLFFTGFNILEAGLPSLISRLAPADAKGAALGVYNTTQALGLFAGGALGGWLLSHQGARAVFLVCGILMVIWWLVTVRQRRWTAPAGMSATH